MVMEPLIRQLLMELPEAGIETRGVYSLIAVYADDVLIYLKEPDKTLPRVMELIGDYGVVSDYSINWSKSVYYKCGPDTPMPEAAEAMKHTSLSFKYLGIQIAKTPDQIYEANYGPLLKYLDDKVNKWKSLPISLAGKIAIVKMVILPKFLYHFHNVPVYLPIGFFNKCKSKIIELMWKGKPPRVAYETLTRLYADGGFELPDFYKYYLAAQFQHVGRWAEPRPVDPQVQMEKKWFKGKDACKLLSHIADDVHPKTGPAYLGLRLWRKEIKKVSGLHPFSPHIALWDIHSYHTERMFHKWTERGLLIVGDLFDGGKMRDDKDVMDEAGGGLLVLMRWRQVKAGMTKMWPTLPVEPEDDTLLTNALTTLGEKHQISRVYNLLRNRTQKQILKVKEKWERELGEDITEDEWADACYWTKHISLSTRIRLIHYRFLMRSYITPHVLNKIKNSEGSECRGCGEQAATFLHTAWACPILKPFWDAVVGKINEICDVNLQGTAKEIFLLDIPGVPVLINRWVCLALTLAKRIVAQNWMRGRPIRLKQWWEALVYCDEQEDVVRIMAHPKQVPKNIWNLYRDYIHRQTRPISPTAEQDDRS